MSLDFIRFESGDRKNAGSLKTILARFAPSATGVSIRRVDVLAGHHDQEKYAVNVISSLCHSCQT